MPDKTLPDLINLLQGTCDILQNGRVISNDKNIVSFNGSKIMGIDKFNPRAEISIEEVK
jgi:Holliday junction resolvase RusA-like endonuclease